MGTALKQAAELEQRETKVQILEALLDEIMFARNALSDITKRRVRLEREFKAAFPSVCPLCGQEVRK